MHEKTLLKISLISGIIGVIALFLISQTAKIPEGGLLEDEGLYTVKGEIKRITELDEVTFVTIDREDDLTVIMFKDYPVDLHKGEFIEVIGKASERDGEVQLIGNQIRIIK